MAEYIDREVALMKLMQDGCNAKNLQSISDIPGADVAPVVHGRWKYYHKRNKAVCTCCSFERDLDENFGAAISCPNCGAKMDGGDGDE